MTPTSAYCLNCGDTYVNGAGACSRCGALCVGGATIQGVEDADAARRRAAREPERRQVEEDLAAEHPVRPTAPNDAPKPVQIRKVVLPNSRVAKLWLSSADTLITTLQKRVAYLQKQRERLNAELDKVVTEQDELQGAIDSLHRIPDKIMLKGDKPWSRAYAQCRGCGSTEERHLAKGYCKNCYYQHEYRGPKVKAS